MTAANEAGVLSRYLVGRPCPEAMARRYEEAKARFPETAGDDPVCALAERVPWTLPLLDAAAPFVKGGERLRARVQLMAAILEASPEFAAEFLPRDSSRSALLAGAAIIGLRAAASAVLGIPLLLATRGET